MDASPVTRTELEHYALGTLDPARRAAIDAAQRDDPDLAARLARIQGDIAAAREDLPAFRIPLEAEDARPWWAALWPPAPVSFGALALALALVAVLPGMLGGSDAPETFTARGAALEVEVLHIRLGEATPVKGLLRAREGDRVQYRFVAPIDGTAAVYNLQDDGTLQAYREPSRVQQGDVVEGAVQLDGYEGSERIFFFVNTDGLDTTAVEGAVQKAWSTPLAELDGLSAAASHQRSLLVVKESL